MKMEGPEFEILSERFVKPFTSTPPSLRSYKLSYHDQIAVQTFVPLAFFYPSHASETSQILEIALSKTLSYYYPFAGRLMGNLFVECNDMGVHFLEATIKCPMTEFLERLNSRVSDLVFRKSLFSPNFGHDDASLVLVQLSYFDCGGMAVSICMSHKLGDASTLSAFMHDWAAMARQSNHIPSPQFLGSSLFPPLDDPSSIEEFTIPRSENSVRKFLFRAPEVAKLKDMVAKSGVKNPTRVEVLSALLYRCAMVSSKSISGSFRPALLVNALNLRPVKALPNDSIGNLVTHFAIATIKEEEMTLPELVSQLRKAKVNIQNEYKDKAKANGTPSVEVAEDQMEILDLYSCSSWCRFPFYSVDFGWGKPLSLGIPNVAASINHFQLMDARDEDSIEAIAMLKDADHLSAFATNEELLAFASLIV